MALNWTCSMCQTYGCSMPDSDSQLSIGIVYRAPCIWGIAASCLIPGIRLGTILHLQLASTSASASAWSQCSAKHWDQIWGSPMVQNMATCYPIPMAWAGNSFRSWLAPEVMEVSSKEFYPSSQTLCVLLCTCSMGGCVMFEMQA